MIDPKAARIRQIGILLYGKVGWQARLARALDLSVSYMSSMMSGARRVTPDVEELLARRLHEIIIPRLEETEAQLRLHVSDMSAELGLDLEPPSITPG
ncbi:hypothetical protein [Hansschlegelia sp. KR7-227]|uniref:hypothetical protein n=1 Tax=Hansschlegelia sp. KR7-227 TaxID=3400914 RepID=UPI003BFD01E3